VIKILQGTVVTQTVFLC